MREVNQHDLDYNYQGIFTIINIIKIIIKITEEKGHTKCSNIKQFRSNLMVDYQLVYCSPVTAVTAVTGFPYTDISYKPAKKPMSVKRCYRCYRCYRRCNSI